MSFESRNVLYTWKALLENKGVTWEMKIFYAVKQSEPSGQHPGWLFAFDSGVSQRQSTVPCPGILEEQEQVLDESFQRFGYKDIILTFCLLNSKHRFQI